MKPYAICFAVLAFTLTASAAEPMAWQGEPMLRAYMAAYHESQTREHKLKYRVPTLAISSKTVVGDAGELPRSSKILQVLNDTEALLVVEAFRGRPMTVRATKWDFSQSVDGQEMPRELFHVVGTDSYETVGGGTNTIFVIAPFKPTNPPPTLKLATEFPSLPFLRTWTSEPHGSKINASFAGYSKSEVSLMGTNGKVITVPLSSLSEEDKRYVRRMITEEREFAESERRRIEKERRYSTGN